MGGESDSLNERGAAALKSGKLAEALQWFTQARLWRRCSACQ